MKIKRLHMVTNNNNNSKLCLLTICTNPNNPYPMDKYNNSKTSMFISKFNHIKVSQLNCSSRNSLLDTNLVLHTNNNSNSSNNSSSYKSKAHPRLTSKILLLFILQQYRPKV